ncbi:hypothetical protein PR048_032848 [Dryococelus australis]|uniref:Uncharacterized protein n=1 Tax=Dryococelus australis TaxID=614101 RepID=A0ABQ9G7J6_9NEOP|nr:hypothetical protein PR048_032848 [Dryococelus australis]
MPVKSIPGISNIQHMSAERNSHVKLGNPSSSTSRIIVPTKISPIPNIRCRKQQTASTSRHGRKPGTCAIITSSPYKERIQNESAKRLLSEKKKDVRRGRHKRKSTVSSGRGAKSLGTKSQGSVPNESTSSVHDDSSDIEVEHSGITPDNDDAGFIFSETKYSEDTQNEWWIQCAICQLWYHSECAGYESGT